MAKGILLPFRTTISGGIQVAEGPEILKQNITLGVIPSSNQHPWNQKLAPREDLIFDIADSAIQGELAAHIYDLFEDLQKLNLATISKTSGGVRVSLDRSNSGDVNVIITYTDLEDNKSREIMIKGVK
jgi:hypothetical protein